jgi:spermidine/putrescine transport system permease protein
LAKRKRCHFRKVEDLLKHKSLFPFTLGIPALVWQVLFFYIPLLITFFSSVVKFTEEGSFAGFTLQKVALFLNPIYGKVLLHSFFLAISNTLLCLFIAYPLAYFLAFTGKKFKNFLLFLLIVPFWTNFLLHVYAWFFVLEREGMLNILLQFIGVIDHPVHFLNSIFSTMVMMIYYYLPFMVLPIYFALERFDYRLIEASNDLGAKPLQTFRRIMLPLTLNGVRAGFFLVYIPSFAEFAIPELMGGDKQMFVGSVVSHYILGEQTGSLGAAFTVISSIALLISAVILYWLLGYLVKPRSAYA